MIHTTIQCAGCVPSQFLMYHSLFTGKEAGEAGESLTISIAQLVLKHQYVISFAFLLNPKDSTIPVIMKIVPFYVAMVGPHIWYCI